MSNFDTLYHSLLSESPMLADRSFRSEMNDPSFNAKETKEIIAHSHSVGKYLNYELYRYLQYSSNKTWDHLIKSKQIEAAVVYEIKNNDFHCWGVWQKRENKGLIRDLFLNFHTTLGYLSITSDPISNELGKQFWKTLLNDIAQQNKIITVLRGKTEEPYVSENFNDYWKVDNTSPFGMIIASDILFKIHLK